VISHLALVPRTIDCSPFDPVLTRALNLTSAEIDRHMVLPNGAADAIALWVAHAHAHDAFDISPILAAVSPEPRCGKSTLLGLLQALVPRPVCASNASPASIFARIRFGRPTLLLDEADTYLNGQRKMRGILNSGHSRSSATVLRANGEFSTWCPKVIASIGALDATLMDRSIVIPLRRQLRSEQRAKFKFDLVVSNCAGLRGDFQVWAETSFDFLYEADPSLPEGFDSRAADNWRPLLAIAEMAGSEWRHRGHAAAIALTAQAARQETSETAVLLKDLREIFRTTSDRFVPTATILYELRGLEDRPWGDYRNRRPLTARQLAEALRPYGIRPTTQRLGSSTPKGYLVADFDDSFERYVDAA
jgi:Protein of unknown function (DUF3631)